MIPVNPAHESTCAHQRSTTTTRKPNNHHNHSHRPGRVFRRNQDNDAHIATNFGDPLQLQSENCVRILFQNVKGLTYQSSGDDYDYYFHHLYLLKSESCNSLLNAI